MFRILCIVAVFALSASALTVRDPNPPTPAEVKCKAAHKIGPEVERTLFTNPELTLKNPATRCYAACILTENKTLKKDGTFNVEFLDKTIPANVPDRAAIIAALKDCSKEKGKDSCETAYKSATCLNSKDVMRKLGH